MHNRPKQLDHRPLQVPRARFTAVDYGAKIRGVKAIPTFQRERQYLAKMRRDHDCGTHVSFELV